jgi:hypothetical protein
MTAKQTADIAESLEKLGYEILEIIDKKEDCYTQRVIKIKLLPVQSSSNFETDPDEEDLS